MTNLSFSQKFLGPVQMTQWVRAIFSATLGTGNDADRSGCYFSRVQSPTGKEIGSLPSLLITSLFDYGASAYLPMADHHWKHIRDIQIRALKVFAGIPRKASNELTMESTGAICIQKTVTKRAHDTIARIHKTCPHSLMHKYRKRAITRRTCKTNKSPLDIHLGQLNTLTIPSSCPECVFNVSHDHNLTTANSANC